KAHVAEGALAVGQAAAEAEGGIGQGQRHGIREHMPGIGQQRQGAGQDAAGHLHHHEGKDQKEGKEHLALVAAGYRWRMGMAVLVAVAVIMVCMGHVNSFERENKTYLYMCICYMSSRCAFVQEDFHVTLDCSSQVVWSKG